MIKSFSNQTAALDKKEIMIYNSCSNSNSVEQVARAAEYADETLQS